MTYKVFYVNDLRECCYVVDCGSQKCVVIDPGMQNAGECGRIADYIRSKELEPAAILLTHAHFDHIMGVNFILRNWNIPVYMNQADERQLRKAAQYALMFGEMIEAPAVNSLKFVNDNDMLTFGSTQFKVLATPGHSEGSVCYLAGECLFCGDTLFAGSIGRTDLPGGSYDSIVESLKTKILPLDPDTIVLPGHGPETTVASEASTNPFLQFGAPDFIQINR